MPAAVLGLDIGGANLKAAHSSGRACMQPFELWRAPADLGWALKHLLEGWPPFERLAVTMTGELCDCFPTRRQGVLAILEVVKSQAEGRPVDVWGIDGSFTTPASACATPLRAAAANWLALAVYAGRFAPRGAAVLIDVGSTTTDIVPLFEGRPVPRGRTDRERLQHRELVYTAVRRTPVCSLLGERAAAELFATTLDAYLLLGELPENANDLGTADARAATRSGAHARIARMVGEDAETLPLAQAVELAAEVRHRQTRIVRSALEHVAASLPAGPETVILSGLGEFLARQALAVPPLWNIRERSLTAELGSELSEAACAYAVAVLAAEQNRHGD
jgi:probable H4MPT-linked C1 transfer pathway protein